MSESEPILCDPLGPTGEEAAFLHGIPEADRHEAWEKLFRDEKVLKIALAKEEVTT
jgi:hypothetical protein